jgi:hypothetical protein
MSDRKMIVETDNYGGDYPDESFVLAFPVDNDTAKSIADSINKYVGERSRRYWKVVDYGYKLQPGFEP